MDYLIEASSKPIKLYSSGQYHVLCLSNRSMKSSLKYIVAIGEGGLAVNMKYPTEVINLIA